MNLTLLLTLPIIVLGFLSSSSWAFNPTQSRPRGSFLTFSSITDDAGQDIYDAAYSGNVVKLKSVLAKFVGNKAVLNWRNTQRYGRTPLVIAAYYNKIESAKLLLSTPGVDVNASSDFGATALHFAAHRGHLEMVQLLLSKGANVNALATGGKWTGKTPLDVVSGMGMSGRPEVSEAIQSKGGKPGK